MDIASILNTLFLAAMIAGPAHVLVGMVIVVIVHAARARRQRPESGETR